MSEQSFYIFFLLMAFLKSEFTRFKDNKKKAQFWELDHNKKNYT